MKVATMTIRLAAPLALALLSGCATIPAADANVAESADATSNAALPVDEEVARDYIPAGYTLETLAIPDTEFDVTGLDIDVAGNVVVATRLGEVWILDAANAGATVRKDDWRLFAEGLDEATGAMWGKDGAVYVAHKPELTRLSDSNGDGVADQFETIADSWEYHDNYHEFNFGPVKDAAGNLYGTLNLGHNVPNGATWGETAMRSAGGYRGWAYRVTPDGEFQPFAVGLRSPAGLGMSPDGDLYYTDNQGDFVETSTIHLLEEGKFYGHAASLRDHPDYSVEKMQALTIEELETMRRRPVMWVPHLEVGNSPGNPEWLTGGGFGPFIGQAFIGDQTQSNVFRAIFDEVNGVKQGAVINFADGFQSGNIRTKFDPAGRLWVGQTQRGWNSRGGKAFGLQRLVWDGKTIPFELQTIKMAKGGFWLTFTKPVAAVSATSGAVKAQSWTYKYSNRYGSDKYDETPLVVGALQLSPDGRSLFVPVAAAERTVMAIDFAGIASNDGSAPSVSRLFYTVNAVP